MAFRKSVRKAVKGAKTIKALMAMDSTALLDFVLKDPLIIELFIKAEVFKAKDGEIYLRIIDYGLPNVETVDGEKTVTLKEGNIKRA